jgi:hypothetical protein
VGRNRKVVFAFALEGATKGDGVTTRRCHKRPLIASPLVLRGVAESALSALER